MKALNKTLAALAVVVFILLAGVIVLAVYSNGFESFAALYVTDGQAVINGSLTLPADGSATLHIKRSGFDKDIGDYTVEVLPNPEYDFEYTVEGETFGYAEAGNLTAAFDITETADGFRLAAPGSVLEVLQNIHNTEEITAQIPTELYGVNPYILRIYTDYGESTITFGQIREIAFVVGSGDGYLYY